MLYYTTPTHVSKGQSFSLFQFACSFLKADEPNLSWEFYLYYHYVVVPCRTLYVLWRLTVGLIFRLGFSSHDGKKPF